MPKVKKAELITPDGSALVVEEEGITIGSHEHCSVVIHHSGLPAVAATIHKDKLAYIVKQAGECDLRVNGRKVDELWLRDGDTVMIGGKLFLFHITETGASGQDKKKKPASKQVARSITSRSDTMPQAEHDEVLQPLVRASSEVSLVFEPKDVDKDVNSLRRELVRLKTALSTGLIFAPKESEEELFKAIIAECFRLIAADLGAVIMLDKQGVPLIKYVCERDKGVIEPSSAGISFTAVNIALETKKGILADDVPHDERFDKSNSIADYGIRSLLAAPLISGEKIIGVLHLDSRKGHGDFTENDLDILAGIASQAAVTYENMRLKNEREHELIVRAELARYLAPQVVEKVIHKEALLGAPEGEMVEAAILFIDMRDFTGIVRDRSPEAVVEILNEFFGAVAEVVFSYGGLLDKFMGDAMMAVWGVPKSDFEPALRAVEAGLAMQQSLIKLNKHRAEQGRIPIEAGCGIETGKVVAGSIGSTRRLEYTVIGTAVNIAARLCQIAKGGEILVGKETRKRISERFGMEPGEIIKLKGYDEPVRPYKIVERRGEHRFVEVNSDAEKKANTSEEQEVLLTAPPPAVPLPEEDD